MNYANKLLVAKPAEGVRVRFSYPKPAHFGVYQKTWPFPMEFDQEYTEIFMPARWLRQRVRTGDPTTNVLFSQQCEELVSGMTEADETTVLVRRLLIHSAGNFLSFSEIAKNCTLRSEHSGAVWRLREQISGQSPITSGIHLPKTICVKRHSASWK